MSLYTPIGKAGAPVASDSAAVPLFASMTPAAITMGVEQQKEVLTSLEELYTKGTYSDLKIVSSAKTYSVHKAVICPRTKFFAAACNGKFKEGHTSIVNLPEDIPDAVEMMMHYFYHLDYPCKAFWESEKRNHVQDPGASDWSSIFSLKLGLALHAQVYALAEKYAIEGLKSVALEKFKKDAESNWSSQVFLDAAKIVYTSTVGSDRGLRDIVVRNFYSNQWLLIQPRALETVRDTDGLAYDLLVYVLRNQESGVKKPGGNASNEPSLFTRVPNTATGSAHIFTSPYAALQHPATHSIASQNSALRQPSPQPSGLFRVPPST